MEKFPSSHSYFTLSERVNHGVQRLVAKASKSSFSRGSDDPLDTKSGRLLPSRSDATISAFLSNIGDPLGNALTNLAGSRNFYFFPQSATSANRHDQIPS